MLAGRDPEAVRQRGEDADLVLGIKAVDVHRRIGLRVTQALGFRGGWARTPMLQLHARQNVIAGAVDDAVEVGDAVADKALAQGLDDRDAAGDARFVIEVGAVIAGRRRRVPRRAPKSRALLAVMTGLPSRSAVRIIVLARVVPPTNSMTT